MSRTPLPKKTNLGKIFGGGDFALDTSTCFVLMPFTDKFQPIYEDHIQRIVTEAGPSSQRADEIREHESDYLGYLGANK